MSESEGAARALRHVGMPVRDLRRSEDFYRTFLGMQLQASYSDCRGPYYEALTGISGVRINIQILTTSLGERLELLEFPSPTASDPGAAIIADLGRAHIAITVNDLAGLHAEGLRRGVSFVSAPLA